MFPVNLFSLGYFLAPVFRRMRDNLFTSGGASGFRIENFGDPSYYRSSLVCNMVVPYHFLHLLCAVRDLSTWIMHLVDECQGFQDRQSCVSWITYHLCVLPGLHSALQRCVAFVCMPVFNSSVGCLQLCARIFRGLHYRVLLVPGAATMIQGRCSTSWYSCPRAPPLPFL